MSRDLAADDLDQPRSMMTWKPKAKAKVTLTRSQYPIELQAREGEKKKKKETAMYVGRGGMRNVLEESLAPPQTVHRAFV